MKNEREEMSRMMIMMM